MRPFIQMAGDGRITNFFEGERRVARQALVFARGLAGAVGKTPGEGRPECIRNGPSAEFGAGPEMAWMAYPAY